MKHRLVQLISMCLFIAHVTEHLSAAPPRKMSAAQRRNIKKASISRVKKHRALPIKRGRVQPKKAMRQRIVKRTSNRGKVVKPGKARRGVPVRAAAPATPPRPVAAAALPAPTPAVPLPPAVISLNRDQLFDDVMGMPENAFKAALGSGIAKPDPAVVRAWFASAKLPERAQAVLQGEWSQPTLKELRERVAKKLETKPFTRLEDFGSLHLLVHDPSKPRETDIRYLHERFPGAFFQIASNFDALEGFMSDFKNNLSAMNHGPVQGEEAVMATMPAAIYRRYFLPPVNLLQEVHGTLETALNDFTKSPVITGLSEGKRMPLNSKDMEGFSVGLHRNIAVTSGYDTDTMVRRSNNPANRNYNRYKPALNKRFEVGALNVSHIYTAAHNINQHQRRDIRLPDPQQEAIAKAVITTAYEATLLAAIDAGAQTLVLTMLGAGAFDNKVEWIFDALIDLSDLIEASGIKIYIVVRHENAKIQGVLQRSLQKNSEQLKKNVYERLHNPTQLKVLRDDVTEFLGDHPLK